MRCCGRGHVQGRGGCSAAAGATRLPLKKIPSTQAKASRRSAKELSLCGEAERVSRAPAKTRLGCRGSLTRLPIHLSAQSAFFLTAGMVSMAWNRWCFSAGSLM